MSIEKSTEYPRQNRLKEAIILESRLHQLFSDIAAGISGKVQSFRIMTDDSFVHRKDRIENDIHLFFQLNNGKYFHLRACARHMLQADNGNGKVFLTAYLKNSIEHTGGVHAFRNEWYDWNPELITNEIISQNPELF